MLESQNVKEQFVIGTSATFDFGVRFFSPNDISCYEYNPNTKTEVLLSSGTDYTIEEKTDYSSGAKVTLLGTLNAGNVLTIVRTALPVQDVSLPNFGKIPSESLETQLDRETAVTQQLHDTVQLTYRMPYGASGTQTPEQYMSDFISRMIPSSGGGGGGGGGSSYNFNSSEFSVTSGGSVSVNKIDKNKITGLTSSLNAKQDVLVSNTTYHIKVDSAGSAGYVPYMGPFAIGSYGLNPYSGIDAVGYGGYVTIGGSSYYVAGLSAGSIFLGAADTVYLQISSGAEPTFSYVKNAGSSTDTVHYTALSRNSGGVLIQQHYGDIILPDWPSSGAAGSTYTGPFAVSLNSQSVGMQSGFVFAGGTRYLISSIEDESLSVEAWGGTVYLTLLSSGGSITSGLTTNPSSVSSGTVVVRLAERQDDVMQQIQYGDITTVPWGLTISSGGMQFPNYASLTGSAYNYIYSNGSAYSSTTNLGSGSKYYAMENGYLRVSLKNASATGLDCLRCSIGGVEIALFDVQSAGGGGSGCLRGATQILPVPKGADFKVYSLSGNWVGDILVKFDNGVSLTVVS